MKQNSQAMKVILEALCGRFTFAGLEALADNGGPTLTHMLSSDSVLIDAGGSDCTGTDQRGASWPVDGDASATAECDIGAVEYGSTP